MSFPRERPARSAVARRCLATVFGLLCLALPVGAAGPLPYDVGAHELDERVPFAPAPWRGAEARAELKARLARELARRELEVRYYRIGHTLAFPLPLARRPDKAALPPGIATITYPWLIWVSWLLEERWRVLHFAWRTEGDAVAGRLLQEELAALSDWSSFRETNDRTGLVAGHVAAVLALALRDPRGWDPALLARARQAASNLIERDVVGWFGTQWKSVPAGAHQLANIPIIALAGAAQLARVLEHPLRAALEERMTAVAEAWLRHRTGPARLTEGTAYDGYLWDSALEWLEHAPRRNELEREHAAAWRSLATAWVQLTLPGRADLHAPIGDVEGEMTFWTTPLARLAETHGWGDAAWLFRRVPLARLPAAALVRATDFPAGPEAEPPAGAIEHPHAVTLRTGWEGAATLAVMSVPRIAVGHLQADAGHIVLGAQGRFWISDPGYQQYRPGEERDFTLGPAAHNAPVIGGIVQRPRRAEVRSVGRTPDGWLHTHVDLARCYPGLPDDAAVEREVWLAADGATLVVRDLLAGLEAAGPIAHHWLGGTELAWALVEGWARLSDGRRVLWIGLQGGRLEARHLTRHPGSRGPLTLAHAAPAAARREERTWVFQFDEAGAWTPPQIAREGDGLRVAPAGGRTPRQLALPAAR